MFFITLTLADCQPVKEFLRGLLKDQPYVALAYMTGVLPMKQYSTGSALNMFKEYTMLRDPYFEEYFGFTQEEVAQLCDRQSQLLPHRP